MWILWAVILGICFTSQISYARRHHDAHVHGALNLSLAAEGKTLGVDLDGAAEGIVGFEHKAKTAEQARQKDAALTKLKSEILNVLGLSSSLGCKVNSSSVELEDEEHHGHHEKNKHSKEASKAGKHHEEEGHSDIEAQFKIICEKDLKGQTLQLNFAKFFPRVQNVKVQVLTEGKQEGITVSKFPAAVVL